MSLKKVAIGVLSLLGCALSAQATPIITYSQDGKHWIPISLIIGTEKANSYYDYFDSTGHPDFGLQFGTATAGVYWDSKRSALSLMLITGSSGQKSKSDKGQVAFKINDLPYSTFLSLSDDPREFKYDKGQSKTVARFKYNNNSDGLVFGGLERTHWTIRITMDAMRGVDHFRLTDGDPSGAGDFILLNDEKPLYLRYASDGTPASNPSKPNGPSKPNKPSTPPIVEDNWRDQPIGIFAGTFSGPRIVNGPGGTRPPGTSNPGTTNPGTDIDTPDVPEPVGITLGAAAMAMLVRRRAR